MTHETISKQEIYAQIQDLPPEMLVDLARYISLLRHKTRVHSQQPTNTTLKVIKLGGIAKGYDFSRELLAAERRLLWGKYSASAA
jgi:hypothetical protein